MRRLIMLGALLVTLQAHASISSDCLDVETRAQQGVPSGQYKLGLVYIKGACGKTASLDIGYTLIQAAAYAGYRDAIYKHAQLTYDYRPENRSMVPELINTAAQKGQMDALAYYGYQALTVDNNPVQACIFYTIALKHNPITPDLKATEVQRDTYSELKRLHKSLSNDDLNRCDIVAESWSPEQPLPSK